MPRGGGPQHSSTCEGAQGSTSSSAVSLCSGTVWRLGWSAAGQQAAAGGFQRLTLNRQMPRSPGFFLKPGSTRTSFSLHCKDCRLPAYLARAGSGLQLGGRRNWAPAAAACSGGRGRHGSSGDGGLAASIEVGAEGLQGTARAASDVLPTGGRACWACSKGRGCGQAWRGVLALLHASQPVPSWSCNMLLSSKYTGQHLHCEEVFHAVLQLRDGDGE